MRLLKYTDLFLSSSSVVPPIVEPVDSRPEGALFGLKVPRTTVHVVSKSPVVVETVPDLSNSKKSSLACKTDSSLHKKLFIQVADKTSVI